MAQSYEAHEVVDGSLDDHGCTDHLPIDGAMADGSVDLERIEQAVREILFAVGENPKREGLRDTPKRVARMYAELFSGLHFDPREYLTKCFTEKYDEVVLVREATQP